MIFCTKFTWVICLLCQVYCSNECYHNSFPYFVHGFHVYTSVWTLVIDEMLQEHCHNIQNLHWVVHKKSNLGHMMMMWARPISGTVTCCIAKCPCLTTQAWLVEPLITISSFNVIRSSCNCRDKVFRCLMDSWYFKALIREVI